MENVKEMTFVGYYSFKSKDKTSTYYIVQVLNHINEGNSCKGFLINVFVDEDIYKTISCSNEYVIGSVLNVQVNANYENNKLSYKILL